MATPNPTPLPPGPAQSDVDLARIKVGAWLIVVAIVAVLIALLIAVNMSQAKAASDVVAVVGAITTFLGTAIGLVFGVHAGASGSAQASTTARIAANLAQQSKDVSDNAIKSMQSTQAAYDAVNMRNTLLVDQIQALDRSNRKARSGARQLYGLAAEHHKATAERILRTLPLDPVDVRDIVHDSVTGWIAAKTGRDPNSIDVSLRFEAPQPDGYGLLPGAYQQMCDDCTADVNARCQSTVTLTGQWRDAHESGLIGDFVTDFTLLVLANS